MHSCFLPCTDHRELGGDMRQTTLKGKPTRNMQCFLQERVAGRLNTQEVQAILGHHQVCLHLVMQALCSLPHFSLPPNAVDSNPLLQLIYAFLVQFNGQLLMTCKKSELFIHILKQCTNTVSCSLFYKSVGTQHFLLYGATA